MKPKTGEHKMIVRKWTKRKGENRVDGDEREEKEEKNKRAR